MIKLDLKNLMVGFTDSFGFTDVACFSYGKPFPFRVLGFYLYDLGTSDEDLIFILDAYLENGRCWFSRNEYLIILFNRISN